MLIAAAHFSIVDYAVLGMYLLVMLAVGAYFSGQQHSSRDFFLAGRSMGWFPVGLSVMATLISALSYTGVPGEAYYVGLKFLLFPATMWLCWPIMTRCVIPIYYNLQIYSVYEYLELRFSLATRLFGSMAFILWRLFWLGGVLYAPCKVLVVAAGLDISTPLLLIVLGTIGTLYTFLGGMKAVIWTDVIQTLVMFGGLLLILAAVLSNPAVGGTGGAWSVVKELGRTELADAEFSWSEKWSLWALAPHVFFAMLSFYIADQITAQRFFTTRNLREVKRSFVLNLASVSVMMTLLMAIGMLLLVFYQQNPQQMRAFWVANLETTGEAPGVGKSILDPKTNEPLLPFGREITPESIGRLVADRKLMRPNVNEPFTDADDLLDTDGNVRIDALAKRIPTTGQWVLHKKAQDQLMPWFLVNQLPAGIAGLVLAALFAASMSSLDSGLNSITTLLIVDVHRRLGVGRPALARWVGKEIGDLEETDELRLARAMVIAIGVAATLFSLLVSRLGNIFDMMITLVNTLGGPLLAVFLLGMFTRRCTSAAALIAMVGGTLLTLWLTVGESLGIGPSAETLNPVWRVTISVVATFAFGYLLSFVVGKRKSRQELTGLVVGLGEPGELEV